MIERTRRESNSTSVIGKHKLRISTHGGSQLTTHTGHRNLVAYTTAADPLQSVTTGRYQASKLAVLISPNDPKLPFRILESIVKNQTFFRKSF